MSPPSPKHPRHPRSPSPRNKENSSHNAHNPPPRHHHLRSLLKSIAEISATDSSRRQELLSDRDRVLSGAFSAVLQTPTPSLLRLCAITLSRLSMDAPAAPILSSPPYLPVAQAALAAAPLQGAGPDTMAVRDGWRLAARALRHIAAFSDQYAKRLARESDVVKLLVARLHAAVTTGVPRAEGVECAAALANFARHGLHFQAYIWKHAGMPALSEAAQQSEDLACKFHACRALAEFSLEQKWMMLLVGEGCVAIMLTIMEDSKDKEILSEATRFLGNVATSKIGREAVNSAGGIEKMVARILTTVGGGRKEEKTVLLTIDLLRTASNLCVNSKDAALTLINLGGVMAFIEAYGGDEDGVPEQVKAEAFRGLLIIAQGGHGCRASVLREIGIKIRQDTAQGRRTEHLYDLGRRIKVEASAERKDDFPETIAGLGAMSKNYLFQAGPLATGMDSSQPPNSVPDIKSPAANNFRQSGRLLSVQRPVHHKERLERDRRERPPRMPAPAHQVHGARGADIQRRPRPAPHGKDDRVLSSDPPRNNGSAHHVGSPAAQSNRNLYKGNNDIHNLDDIPTCKVIDRNASHGQKGQNDGNWVLAVWSAVCNAVTRPPNIHIASGVPGKNRGENISGVPTPELHDDNGEDVFEIGVPLGRGGFATVYLAKNIRTGELVAVKRFHPLNLTTPDARKKAELAARRAIKEQRIWDGLHHKNVVSYRGCFFGENGELNLVAEYIPGWSLADHLSQISRFPEHMVACITLQIVDGLDYLHKCGVTHRDVKPANILVNPDGVIKITDFGVSSAVDVPTMTGNTVVGTPWYIAPEMIEGRPYGKSVDIWSLGCTVLELATGRRPYHSLRPHVAMYRMTQDRMPPIPKKLSQPLRDFLKTCWVWNPPERPTPAHLRRHPFLATVGKPELRNLKNMTRDT